jgi:hypothetical protein
MKRLAETLENERPMSEAVETEAEGKLIRSFGFLSQKPALVVRNCDEAEVGQTAEGQIAGLPCLQLSARIELELAQLSDEDRAEFLADLGLEAPAKDRLIRACYQRLNLISFLTAGEPEVRAWSVPAGTSAVDAAGAIHSDIARGFIRAETVAYDDLKSAGTMKDAKSAGTVRLEGKTYVVRDGDVIYFRFNV